MDSNHFGVLYIVATPIGNLEDMTFRAIDVLKKVSWIAAEDTRHSGSLLKHYSIKTPLFALHDHNERDRTEELLNRLKNGESIALISDAGTPLISDPGYFLVRETRAAGVKVIPIPGPCAAICALSVSGLATDRFVFEGFLTSKTQARLDHLTTLIHEPRTLVFYEAPHRILDTLHALVSVFGPHRKAVLARELTKMFETVHEGELGELAEWVKLDSNQQRGEIVLMVEGNKQANRFEGQEVLLLLLENLPLKQAVEVAAKITGQRKNELYQLALTLKNNHAP